MSTLVTRRNIFWTVSLTATAILIGFGPIAVTSDSTPHWAFRKLSTPSVPRVQNHSRVRTPVDAFILAALEAKGLGLSPEANRATLIRRASYDLLGLPPTVEEIDAFEKDPRPDAYERLLDRLLASPHFGERWGRHWLDGAGYVDVTGGDNDAATVKLGENKWRYRDYVVQSFNKDKPFDQFLTQQLAGDELVDWRSAPKFTPEIEESLIATGFLRVAADDTDENELNTPDIRHGVLQRTGETLASNLLALTVNCAKCHDHKFEPIPQEDYYRFLAILAPAFNPDRWLQPKQRALPNVSPAEKTAIEAHNAAIDREVAGLKKQKAEILRPYEKKVLESKLAKIPEPIRADVKTAIETPAAKRSAVQKYLADKFSPALQVNPAEVASTVKGKDKDIVAQCDKALAEANKRRRSWGHWQAVYDVGPPTPVRILKRGNHEKPGDEVQAGLLSVLTPSPLPLSPEGRGKSASSLSPRGRGAGVRGDSSGRRLALARQLTDWNSPAGGLVARVRVNRIWQHLFGEGLVKTSENLGVSGTPPSHPELLDWLASEFVGNGRLTKPFLKMLMTSAVYRQASAYDGANAANQKDPDNRLLWRMRLRRLESETVRDALLAVGGRLDETMGGPPIPTEAKPDGLIVIKPSMAGVFRTPVNQYRRSLYLLARRHYHPVLLNVFDQPVMATNCTRREPSAVVLQSLTMLNDEFVLDQAGAFAGRVAKKTANAEERIQLAYRIALGRKPKPPELKWCSELLTQQKQDYQKLSPEEAERRALAHLCQMLLNTNEFLYVP